MTFEAARRNLARIAKGEYHALKYELTMSSSDCRKLFPTEAKCSVYIHGVDWYSADTWAGAFAKMKADTDRRKKRPRDPAEQPGDEASPKRRKRKRDSLRSMAGYRRQPRVAGRKNGHPSPVSAGGSVSQ